MSKEKTSLKPVDAPVYNYWTALYKSFYSSNLYVDVGKRWKGVGLLYLLLVILIFSAPLAYKTDAAFKKDIQEQFTKPLTKLPRLYMQNGKISVDQPMPYLIKNDHDQVVIIVDTSGKITDYTKEYPYLYMLITQEKIMLKVPKLQLINKDDQTLDSTPMIQTFNKSTNGIIDGKQAEERVNKIVKFTQVMIYPLIAALLYSIFMVLFLVFAFMAQLYSIIFFSFQITYKQACRLLTVSSTPTFALIAIYETFDIAFSGRRVIILPVFFAWYTFAVYSLRKESRHLVSR